MKRVLQGSALAALLLAACGSFWVAGGGGFYYYDDDCHYDDHYYYCDDYYYDDWYPYAVVATDFDGDGRVDLAVGDGRDEVVWLVRGQEPGGVAGAPDRRLLLSAVATQVALFRPHVGSVPGLLVLDAATGELGAFGGDGSGGFLPLAPPRGPAAFPASARFARGRIDGDDADDLVSVDATGVVHVALGSGTGTFDEVDAGDPGLAFLGPSVASRLAGVHVALAEFDGEPGADLLLVDGERAALAVYSGRRDGTFGEERRAEFRSLGDVLSISPVTLEPAGRAALAILFGDRGDAAAASTLAVVRSGDGSFAVEGKDVGSARSIAAWDLDGDGRSELLLADAVRGTIRTLRVRRD